MFNLKSLKTQLILFLAAVALILSIKERDFSFLAAIAIAVLAAVVIESVILYLKTKSLQVTESSIITGMIIGYVVSNDEIWWKFILVAAISVISKYLIIYKKRHILNPAAFGIFLSVLLLGVSTQWKATYMWYILTPFGFYFAYRIKKLEVILGYAIVSLVLFGAQAALNNIPPWKVFGYFSYFYIFVMVIEPKTSPFNKTGKYLFGAGIAALIFILTEAGARFDVELFSLLAINLAAPALNKLNFKNGGQV